MRLRMSMRAQHNGFLERLRCCKALEVLLLLRCWIAILANISFHLSQLSPANAQEDRSSWLEARSWLIAGLSCVPVNANARHRCCIPLLASAERNSRSSSREELLPGLLQLLQLWVEQQPAEVSQVERALCIIMVTYMNVWDDCHWLN